MRASLRAEYGITDIRSESVHALAEYLKWLPAGAALWRSYGGPLSQSAETRLLVAVEFRLRELAWMQSEDGSKGRNRPKPPEPPPYAHAVKAEDAFVQRQAAAYRARQARS